MGKNKEKKSRWKKSAFHRSKSPNKTKEEVLEEINKYDKKTLKI